MYGNKALLTITAVGITVFNVMGVMGWMDAKFSAVE